MTRVQTDAHGLLVGFSHHDGFIDGLLTDAGAKRVDIALRSSSGDRRLLTLRGVTAMHVGGFREGNIVARLRLLPIARAAADEGLCAWLVERLYVDPATLSASTLVFVVEASYGAELIALCEEVDVGEPGSALTRSS